MAAGLAQIVRVQLDDVGILMGLADGLGFVLLVEAGAAGRAIVDIHPGGGVHNG